MAVMKQKNSIMTVTDLFQLAKLAESPGPGGEDVKSSDSKMAELEDVVRAGREEVQQLTARMAGMSVSVTQRRSPTPERRLPRKAFLEPNTTLGGHQDSGTPTYNRRGRILREQCRPYNDDSGCQFSRPGTGMSSSPCVRCDRYHAHKKMSSDEHCFFICGRVGHFRVKCRGAKNGAMNISG